MNSTLGPGLQPTSRGGLVEKISGGKGLMKILIVAESPLLNGEKGE